MVEVQYVGMCKAQVDIMSVKVGIVWITWQTRYIRAN
jgi:hypothetical protein